MIEFLSAIDYERREVISMLLNSFTLRLGTVVLITVLCCFSGAFAGQYTVTDLGTLGGSYSGANGLNNAGQVAGYAAISTDDLRAYRWQGGVMSDLGTLGGSYSSGYAINDAGLIVGETMLLNDTFHAFIWESDIGMTDLGTFGGSESSAIAVNSDGLVVGYATLPGELRHAFISNGVSMTDLGTLGGSESLAYGINDAGQVVGDADDSNGNRHACLWQAGSIQDLGTLSGPSGYSGCNDINNFGQVVGYTSTNSGDNHGFLWKSSTGTKDLGTLGGTGSYAYAINDVGEVVGEAMNSSLDWVAVIWRNNTMTDLNSLLPTGSGWQLIGAYGVNNLGQVIGTGVHNGSTRAYLLTPSGTSVSGTVTLQDFSGDKTKILVTIEFRQGGITTTKMAILDSSGNYKVLGIAPGTYDIAFKASHWLRKVSPSQAITGDTTGVNVSLTNGDINGDNSVGLLDLGQLKSSWGSSPPTNLNADLNGDNSVGLLDLAIVKKNWGKTGNS